MRQAIPVQKAAEVMGVCEQTIRNLYHRRELEGYQVGKKLLLFADSITAFQTLHGNQQPEDVEPETRPVFKPIPYQKKNRRRQPTFDRFGLLASA